MVDRVTQRERQLAVQAADDDRRRRVGRHQNGQAQGAAAIRPREGQELALLPADGLQGRGAGIEGALPDSDELPPELLR